LIIEGVAYLQQVPVDATGTFTALGVAASPTGAYTATVTDQNGNTSELMFGCGGAAQAVKALDGGGSTLDFGTVAVPNAPKAKKQRTRQFTVQNLGCSPLTLTFVSLRRSDASAASLDPRRNDTDLFSVTRVVNSGNLQVEEAVSFSGNGTTYVINPGSSETFVVRFSPVVPPVPTCQCVSNLLPSDVLPDHITSTINLLQNGQPDAVPLSASLRTGLRLINPNAREPRQPPLVTLTRLADEYVVQYSIYD